MMPDLWIFDTYSLCILIGVIACLYVYYLYGKHNKLNKSYAYDIMINAILSVIIGLFFAVAFQTVFDLLKKDSENPMFSMTFYGGLIGGAIFFIIYYKLLIKKKYPHANFFKDVLIVAPACITLAHGFGRIGCFFAGCCYGVETTSFLGVRFPGMEYKVYPTQLFEALFLFILFAVLAYLAFKHKNINTFSIYLLSYGIFRFLIEFIRGDDRGAFFLSLSPSQWISIIAIIISILLYFFLKKINKIENK